MLNSCYIVLATAMTIRTGAVIESLIDPDQTGFISSRHITENIRQLMDTLHYCNTEQIKGAIIMLDLEKAYDRVDHGWVFKILKKCNFGEEHIGWVRLMYHQARKTVLCNGQQTDWVPVKSGVPQGCPFSCYIFVLSIEPLHEHMRKTKNCEGITLPNGQQLKTSGFADDTALYISNPDAHFELKKALDL